MREQASILAVDDSCDFQLEKDGRTITLIPNYWKNNAERERAERNSENVLVAVFKARLGCVSLNYMASAVAMAFDVYSEAFEAN